jgi:hypothetical protein
MKTKSRRKPLPTPSLEDTWLDLSEELAADSANEWARTSGRSTTPQFTVAGQYDFLDNESDLDLGLQRCAEGLHFDAVFESPVVAETIEVWSLDDCEPAFIGRCETIGQANQLAAMSKVKRFGVKGAK